LRSLRREGVPIFVTENGIADADDSRRAEFLLAHVDAMLLAIKAGAPVRGYFHWTCFDNFEWAEGYSAKFGLIACDPLTQERRPRPSARLYAQICLANELPASVEPPPAPQPSVEPAGPADLR
jgi:beta-glucosidase